MMSKAEIISYVMLFAIILAGITWAQYQDRKSKRELSQWFKDESAKAEAAGETDMANFYRSVARDSGLAEPVGGERRDG